MKLLVRFVLTVGLAAGLGLAALPAADDPPQFGDWSVPLNLGPIVNAWGDWRVAYDGCPTISKDGLSLYFRSNRPGGQGPPNTADIWVSQRDTLEDSWGAPVNLGPTINGPASEFCTTFSPDGHWMVFVSTRAGCGGQDLWISHRRNKRDDFGWETPANLGCVVNSTAAENGPAWFEDEATGTTLLYFSSGRPGLGSLDIYVSEALSDEKGDFGPPSLVAELSTSYTDYQPALRRDGLELFFASGRPGGLGAYPDLWTSTRESTLDPWSSPVNLGPLVNSDQYDFRPTLSWDGTTLIFASERGGPSVGWGDLWMTTRSRLKDP